MSGLWASREMDGVEPIDQAKRAIAQTLGRISQDRYVGFYLGLGTQTFSLLTEAAATLWGRPIEEVRRKFAPAHVADPAELVQIAREAAEELIAGPAGSRAHKLGLKLRNAVGEFKA